MKTVTIFCWALLLSASTLWAEEVNKVRVLVWSEMTEPKNVYPDGINGAIAAYLNSLPGIQAKAVSINDPEQGLTESELGNTDVLFWWGHARHGDITDTSRDRVVRHVKERGMGFVALHSAHFAKPFIALLDHPCGLGGTREEGEPEHLKVMAPEHPIARGIKDFTIPQTEMYAEPFGVPKPETVVLRSGWDRGEEFRSCCTWSVGKGRVVYFRPGHETYRIMLQPEVQRILRNTAFWAARQEGPGLESVVDLNVKPEKLAGNFKFTEGPVWNRKGSFLLFNDIPADTTYKWTPDGKVSVFRQPSHEANGLTYDHKGNYLACEHKSRQVTLTEPDGDIRVIADRYNGKRLSNPNDIVVARDGSIYFTDPAYGIKPEEREIPNAVYRLKDGKLQKLLDDFDRPNGLAFSPDQKTLYIADSSNRMHIRAFDVLPDGTLANSRVFADLRSKDPGAPDGMKVDIRGNLWSSGPGGIWVFAKTGVLMGVIPFPEVPANLAFGGPDGKTLFVTARTGLYRLPVKVEGIRP